MTDLDTAIQEGLEIGYQIRAVMMTAATVCLWLSVAFIYREWGIQHPFWFLVFASVIQSWNAAMDVVGVIGAHVLKRKRQNPTE